MTGPNPHDVFFKAIFGAPRVAADALKGVLPAAVAAAIDWSRLERVPAEFVDGELGDRRADLMFRAPLHDAQALLVLLFEHQSSIDRLMPYRALVYGVRFWQGWLRDHPGARSFPVVVPIVLYHGDRPWTGPVRFGELLDLPAPLHRALAPFVPSFELVLIDLTRVDDDTIETRSRSAQATVAMLALKNAAYLDDIGPLVDRLEPHLVAAAREPGAAEALAEVMCYLYGVSDVPQGEVEHRIIDRIPPPVREAVMTTAEKLREEGRRIGREEGREVGRAEGREEGREEGELTGTARTLLRLLKLKFGAVDERVRARVEAADHGRLIRWTDRILTAERLEDVFR